MSLAIFNDFLKQNGEAISRKKNETIIGKNNLNNGYLYFVNSGLLKSVYITHDGREFIKTFVTTNDFIGSLSSLRDDAPNTFILKCIEDSFLTRIKYAALLEASQTNLEFANVIIQMLLNLIIKKEKRAHDFLCLSAEERYIKMRQETPDLLNRIKQTDIAGYLGITPVALSRIKARLTK